MCKISINGLISIDFEYTIATTWLILANDHQKKSGAESMRSRYLEGLFFFSRSVIKAGEHVKSNSSFWNWWAKVKNTPPSPYYVSVTPRVGTPIPLDRGVCIGVLTKSYLHKDNSFFICFEDFRKFASFTSWNLSSHRRETNTCTQADAQERICNYRTSST